MKMGWRWLWNPWISATIAVGTIAISAAIFLLTGILFIFFVLPIPIVFWSFRKRTA